MFTDSAVAFLCRGGAPVPRVSFPPPPSPCLLAASLGTFYTRLPISADPTSPDLAADSRRSYSFPWPIRLAGSMLGSPAFLQDLAAWPGVLMAVASRTGAVQRSPTVQLLPPRSVSQGLTPAALRGFDKGGR